MEVDNVVVEDGVDSDCCSESETEDLTSKQRKRKLYKARRKEKAFAAKHPQLTEHERAVLKLKIQANEKLVAEREKAMNEVKGPPVDPHRYNAKGLPVFTNPQTGSDEINLVAMMIDQTAQGKWWKSMSARQTEFSDRCRGNGITWSMTEISSLMNRDCQNLVYPRKALDLQAMRVRTHWVELEAEGFEIAFQLRKELYEALKHDGLVLPFFHIIEYCLQPVHKAPPVTMKEFRATLVAKLQQTMSCMPPQSLDWIQSFNESRYSDMFEAMVTRFANQIGLKEARSKRFDPNLSYITMFILLLVFGGRLY